MTIAFVMINCNLGAEAEIIEKVSELEQTKEIFETIGAHDIMVKLEGENFEKIREVVSWKIQPLDKIRSTLTLVRKDT